MQRNATGGVDASCVYFACMLSLWIVVAAVETDDMHQRERERDVVGLFYNELRILNTPLRKLTVITVGSVERDRQNARRKRDPTVGESFWPESKGPFIRPRCFALVAPNSSRIFPRSLVRRSCKNIQFWFYHRLFLYWSFLTLSTLLRFTRKRSSFIIVRSEKRFSFSLNLFILYNETKIMISGDWAYREFSESTESDKLHYYGL